ncbi:hypothetical protein JCM21900_003138 [Sporobolomyces salmonicolor]
MAILQRLLLALVPLLAVLAALLKPRLEVLGVFRTPSEARNIGGCARVDGLEACEDGVVLHDKGLAYLACSTRSSRALWAPALQKLSATSLPATSTDTIRLFSFSTLKHSPLELVGLPLESQGIWVHGIDVFPTPSEADPDLLAVFVISHRPPYGEREKAESEGASSVIEIFETRVGAYHAEHVKTVEHKLVVTPNNLVATGPRSFFVSNDHARKVHWTRKLELLHSEPSTIVHCDASGDGEPHCIVAADGLVYPNGIAKGRDDLLYSASTLGGEILTWEIQSDKTLIPLDTVPLSRPVDNIHVSPSTGNVYASAIPKLLDFVTAATAGGRDPHRPSPVEIWRIANETGEKQFYGQKYKTELVLSDSTEKAVSAITSAIPYEDKLLLTGYFTEAAVVCKFPDVL